MIPYSGIHWTRLAYFELRISRRLCGYSAALGRLWSNLKWPIDVSFQGQIFMIAQGRYFVSYIRLRSHRRNPTQSLYTSPQP
ncbi:hypothetical protein A0H81_13334 [Grifola frondosa]|uniref:Uncharacterized protein n=1 Tax=Grifola frondosa TaxID=5627 RepID=A0A1C7LPX2_GRIFR|nr:hypothetical protein A0H81_13334 [Grifola frondosa]